MKKNAKTGVEVNNVNASATIENTTANTPATKGKGKAKATPKMTKKEDAEVTEAINALVNPPAPEPEPAPEPIADVTPAPAHVPTPEELMCTINGVINYSLLGIVNSQIVKDWEYDPATPVITVNLIKGWIFENKLRRDYPCTITNKGQTCAMRRPSKMWDMLQYNAKCVSTDEAIMKLKKVKYMFPNNGANKSVTPKAPKAPATPKEPKAPKATPAEAMNPETFVELKGFAGYAMNCNGTLKNLLDDRIVPMVSGNYPIVHKGRKVFIPAQMFSNTKFIREQGLESVLR